MKKSECPKCNAPMKEGLLAVNSQEFQCLWFAGNKPLAFNVMTGDVIPYDRRRLVVNAWRCGKCGFLEFYAKTKK